MELNSFEDFIRPYFEAEKEDEEKRKKKLRKNAKERRKNAKINIFFTVERRRWANWVTFFTLLVSRLSSLKEENYKYLLVIDAFLYKSFVPLKKIKFIK